MIKEISPWKPISTAPLDGTSVLVYARKRKGGFRITEAANPTGVQWWSKGIGTVKPTHWMPLPAAPPPEELV
jgi:hypothetical protein